ncbi:hypothetical protein QQF64_015775 [Cirrhinus molitorella]|uniref:Uncharacterized protein n=1 Tax=Cirrhinus molitorella TaxID=172907 RepID=A0ABR3NVW7_9TELE
MLEDVHHGLRSDGGSYDPSGARESYRRTGNLKSCSYYNAEDDHWCLAAHSGGDCALCWTLSIVHLQIVMIDARFIYD